MDDKREAWLQQAERNGWKMPVAPAWKRLPVIRHVRAIWCAIQVERWYSSGPGMIGVRTGYDDWALWGIWHGLERSSAKRRISDGS